MRADPFTSFQRQSCFSPRWFGCVFAIYLFAFEFCIQAQAPENELRTVAAVCALSVAQAAQQVPVRLSAVVTFFDEPLYSRFIQDDTAGIYLQASTNTPPLVPGQVVEIEGRTNPGEYAPVILPDKVRVVGTSALPAPKPVTYEQLAGGSRGSLFVEVTGIVRSVQFQEASQFYVLEIATGSGRLSAYTRRLPVTRAEEMLDSGVRVRGVCSAKFNHQRQLFAIRLMVPRAEDLMIEIPAPADPFAVAVRPIGSLLQFTPKESNSHRDKVAGTVIHFEPGRLLVLQDGHEGVEVQTQGSEPLALGDRVEALGFVSQGDYTPVLQDAVYRKISAGPPLPPVRLTPDEALKAKHDCQLIQMEARLLDRADHGAERYLVLQKGGFIFNADFSRTEDPDRFTALKNGSRVLVTGVCRIDPGEWVAGEDWRAKSFRVELRSLGDVLVLESPSWWTLQKVLWIGVAVVVAALVAFSWVVVLHRRVAERGLQLEIQILERQRVERQHAIEQERTRVAQDLHDELGATLTEVAMLGTLAQTPELPLADRGRYLGQLTATARTMVANLDEIVWAVNPKYDSVASLASYFSLFAQRFLNLAGIACRLRMADTLPTTPLDAHLRHGVFLAFKEALNNAVRHSGATSILIEMEMAENQLRIAVIDNGRGFAPSDRQPGSDGLANMQERMSNLGGRCAVKSQPDKGTTVEFWLPLGDHAV